MKSGWSWRIWVLGPCPDSGLRLKGKAMAKKKLKKRQKKQGTGAPGAQWKDVRPATVVEQASEQEPQAVAAQAPTSAEQGPATVQAQASATQTKDVAVQADASVEQMPATVQEQVQATQAPAQNAQSAGQVPEATFTVTLPRTPDKAATYSAALFVRLLPEDKAKLQVRAVKAGMSLAAYCRAVLESVARRDD